MIGRVLWRVVCRVFEVPLISGEMLDAVDVAIREQAAEWGVVVVSDAVIYEWLGEAA